MRILITADLHYRPSQREAFVAFADWVQAQQPDCLAIAGDIGHPLRLFRRALQLFAGLDCPKLLLAGNHDLYRGEVDSRTLWEQALPEATRAEGFVWLEDEVIRLPLGGAQKSGFSEESGFLGRHIAIVGTMGWYDYSARAPHLELDDAALRAMKRLVNHDADYIDWPWSDVAMARYLSRRFAGRRFVLRSGRQRLNRFDGAFSRRRCFYRRRRVAIQRLDQAGRRRRRLGHRPQQKVHCVRCSLSRSHRPPLSLPAVRNRSRRPRPGRTRKWSSPTPAPRRAARCNESAR